MFHCFNCEVGGNAIQLVELVRFGEITKGGSSDTHRKARDELAEFVGFHLLDSQDRLVIQDETEDVRLGHPDQERSNE